MERESINEALISTLADRDEDGLVQQTSSPQVIVGPRRVGKSTLLKLTNERAIDAGIHVVELDEDLLTGAEGKIMEAITPSGRRDMFNHFLEHRKGAIRYEEMFNFEMGPSGKVMPMDLEASLAAGALAGPMAILLDDAHKVPTEHLQEFCISAQSLMGKGYPLALILAGTPELWPMLMERDGTCMEWGIKLSFNLFTVEEAQEALSKGFEDTGLKVDSRAIEYLVEQSDRHPYFVQLAGHWTWEQAEKNEAGSITMELAKSGLELASEEREAFHDTRHTELLNHGVLKEAFQVMDLMAGRPDGLKRAQLRGGLRRVNKGMDSEGAMEVERKLINHGFLHEGRGRLVPGIPSLFDYLRSNPELEDNSL